MRAFLHNLWGFVSRLSMTLWNLQRNGQLPRSRRRSMPHTCCLGVPCSSISGDVSCVTSSTAAAFLLTRGNRSRLRPFGVSETGKSFLLSPDDRLDKDIPGCCATQDFVCKVRERLVETRNRGGMMLLCHGQRVVVLQMSAKKSLFMAWHPVP